jgi:hypothetical protein
VTAAGAKGDTIRVANALVQLWTTDATTTALRDSACTAWLADKTVWLQAREELDAPSGMSIADTPLGRDVDLLHSLVAVRRDTVRTSADGSFTFRNVSVGAYTVEAEVFANDKFLQWSSDAGVIPREKVHVSLDPSVLAENQYCAASTASPSAQSTKIYDIKDLDRPLVPIDARAFDPSDIPIVPEGSFVIDFVVDERGFPDLATTRVESASYAFSAADARNVIANLRFEPPTVHGKRVRVLNKLAIGVTISSRSH